MDRPRIFTMPFSSISLLYIQKAEKKGRTKKEVDEIIFWLTGYDEHSLEQQVVNKTDIETFFKEAPHFNPNAILIKVQTYYAQKINPEMR